MEEQGRRWEWLARKCEISGTYMSHIKNGKRPIPTALVPLIASELGVNEDDILEDSPKQEKVGVA